MNNRVSPVYVETLSGEIVDLTSHTYGNVTLEDILDTLELMPRFNGRAREYGEYITVLQHSYAMYRYMRDVMQEDNETCVLTLMHDAHEALVGDIISPLANVSPGFSSFLDRVQRKVLARFGLGMSEEQSLKIKEIDLLALKVEWAEFVAVDYDVRRRNGHHYGWDEESYTAPAYGDYLNLLNQARSLSHTELVKECQLIIYKHIAQNVLKLGA